MLHVELRDIIKEHVQYQNKLLQIIDTNKARESYFNLE